jgi:hypothetical protein
LLFEVFTTDSSYLTYDVSTSSDDSSGTLSAISTAADAGAPVQLGVAVESERVATGAKVIIADNYVESAGTADVHAIDLAAGSAPTLVAAAASGFRLSHDRTRILYSTNGGVAGLYVVAVP